MPCKKSGCPGTVEFDGEIKIPGNFKTMHAIVKNRYQIKVEGDVADDLTIGSVKITQGKNAKIQEQTIRFHFDQQTDLVKKDTFYLTCTKGHTLPYTITIEDV